MAVEEAVVGAAVVAEAVPEVEAVPGVAAERVGVAAAAVAVQVVEPVAAEPVAVKEVAAVLAEPVAVKEVAVPAVAGHAGVAVEAAMSAAWVIPTASGQIR